MFMLGKLLRLARPVGSLSAPSRPALSTGRGGMSKGFTVTCSSQHGAILISDILVTWQATVHKRMVLKDKI